MASRGVDLAQRGVPSKMIAGKRKAHSRWTRSHISSLLGSRQLDLWSCQRASGPPSGRSHPPHQPLSDLERCPRLPQRVSSVLRCEN